MKTMRLHFILLLTVLVVLSFSLYAQERGSIQSIVTTDAEDDGRIHEIELYLSAPIDPGETGIQEYLDGLWAQGIAEDFSFSEDFVVPIGMLEGSEINTFIFQLEPIESTTTAFNVDYTSNPARRINTMNSTGYLLSFAAQNVEDRTRPVLKTIEVGYDGSEDVNQITMVFTEPMHTPQTSTQGINIPGVSLPANGVWDTTTRFRLDVTSNIQSLFYHDVEFVAGEVLLRDPLFTTNRVNSDGEYYVEKAIRVAREEVELTLSDDITSDISEETLITATMVYPVEFLEGLPADLFVDAWLTADPALPEDTEIAIEYNGNPVTTYTVGHAGLGETWLSNLLPIDRTYLIGHENLTDVWTLRITGVSGDFEDNGIYEAETYTLSATSFFGYDFADPSKVYDNGPAGYDGYDEVEITFNSYQAALDLVALNTSLLLEQAGINYIEATIEYPANIAGILSDYMLDALIEASVDFPAGTELSITYNETYLTTYTMTADTGQIYLSEMIPAPIPTRTPLLGHGGLVDVWGIDVLLPFVSDTAFVADLTVKSVTSDDDFDSEFLLAEDTEGITIDTYSTYKFVYDVPLLVIAGEESIIDVTFETDEEGTLGYDDVRFKIEADGPGVVTFTAGNHSFEDTGFWGPAEGFALPASYTATTQWTLEFSEDGQYNITFSLIEAPDGDVVAGITQDQEIDVEAVPAAVYVDLLWAGSDFMQDLGEGKFFGYNAFAVIQEGIDALTNGGTVNVAAGLYEEAVLIDKAGVELHGAQSGVDARNRTGVEETIIDGFGIYRQAILISSDDIVIDGFTIQNPSYAGNVAAALILLAYDHQNSNIAIRNNIMHSPGDTTVGRPWGIFAIEGTKATELIIEQNHIYDILFDNASGTWNATGGMWLWEDLYDVTIQNNKIENVSTFGIGISTGITGCLVKGNEISGVGYETSASYPSAIRVGTSNSITVQENIISDCAGTAMTSGIYLLGSTDVTVIDNNISSSFIGIYARGAVFSGLINDNNLFDNSVQVDDPFELLDIENILANNYFDRAVVVRGSAIQVPKIFSYIQAAIDAAEAGHTIEVSAGLFVGNLEINVPDLTLKSVADYDAIIQTQAGFNAGSGFGGITILADGVTLDGFRIEQGVPQAVVHTHNSNNVTIKNNKIIGVDDARPRGIDVGYASANSDNVFIYNNEFEHLYCGVYVNRATNLEIEANYFEDMNDGAIVFDGTWYYGDINVVNNTATDANYLMYFFGEQGPVTYSGNEQLTNTLLTNFGVHNTDKNILYSTIQAAIDGAEENDTILLSDGTYYENIIIHVPGLTITNASTPVIDGGGSGAVVLITANGVTLEGLTIQNSGTEDTDAGIFLNQVTGCYISGNTIIDNGNGVGIVMGSGNTLIDNEITNSSLYGIVLVGTSGNTIESNEIDTALLDGIALANASEVGGPASLVSTLNTIKTNSLTNITRDGIFIGENCDNNSITDGNMLDVIGSIGINLWRSGEQTIVDNTISSTLTGLRLLGSSNNTITGNSIVDNNTGIKVDASWQEGVWYPSENNTISENNISGNTAYGMRADDPEQTPVVATYNWWGHATGPEHSTNALGLGNAVSDKVLFSPWYFQEEMQTLNGLPELVLSEIGDIYTVTNTPIVIDLTVSYPDLTDFDPAVFTDAVLSTTEAAFPAGTKVIDVLYNGNSILTEDYDLAGSNTHFLSDILGSQAPYGTPLVGHSNLAIDWTFVITGAEEALAELPVSMQSISYLDRDIGYNELGTPQEFTVTYADVDFPGFADLVVGIPNPIVIEWTESYPLIENIGGNRVLNDSKFMIYDDEDNPAYLPVGTTITVTIPGATPVVRTSVLSVEAYTIYGSAVVTQQTDPTTNQFGYLALLEREATIPGQEAEWMVTIEGANAGNYVVKFEAIAVLDIDAGGYPFDGEFIYMEDEFSVEVVAVSPILYVNHLWEGSNPMQEVETDKFFGHNAFATIQDAVSAANPGDEIQVAAGEYVEVGQIVIDKDLTIIGDNNETTIIKPIQNIENWFLVEAGNTFDLSHVTLDGEGKNIRAAIRTHGSGSIENCIIKNIAQSTYLGWGIALTWSTPDQDWTISQNVFENIERVGILVDGHSNSATITGNTFIGNGDGDWVGYGVEVGDGAYATINGNTITDYRGVAESDGSTSAAILVTSFFGPDPEALITGNTIENNTTGVYVGYEEDDTSDVTATGNTFNNNRYQVRARIGVDFDMAATLAGNTFDRAVVVREEINTRQNSIIVPAIFSFIQDAIDDASDGHAIDVQTGTYTEQLVIDKGLNVVAQEDVIIKAPPAAERTTQLIPESTNTFDPIVLINGDEEAIDVTLSGFNIDGNNEPGSNLFTGILARNSNLVIIENEIYNIYATHQTNGISTYGGSSIDVIDNKVSGFSRNAITVFDPSIQATISGNIITGPGYATDWAPNGIQVVGAPEAIISDNDLSDIGWIWPGSGTRWSSTAVLPWEVENVTIEGNEFTDVQVAIRPVSSSFSAINNTIVVNNIGNENGDLEHFGGIWGNPQGRPQAQAHPFDIADNRSFRMTRENELTYVYTSNTLEIIPEHNIEAWGIAIWPYDEDGMHVIATATDNTVTNWQIGFDIWGGDDFEAQFRNNFIANNSWGMWNWTNTEVDAIENYWGDPTGPTHATNPLGAGDIISDLVLYDPWWQNDDMTGVGTNEAIDLAIDAINDLGNAYYLGAATRTGVPDFSLFTNADHTQLAEAQTAITTARGLGDDTTIDDFINNAIVTTFINWNAPVTVNVVMSVGAEAGAFVEGLAGAVSLYAEGDVIEIELPDLLNVTNAYQQMYDTDYLDPIVEDGFYDEGNARILKTTEAGTNILYVRTADTGRGAANVTPQVTRQAGQRTRSQQVPVASNTGNTRSNAVWYRYEWHIETAENVVDNIILYEDLVYQRVTDVELPDTILLFEGPIEVEIDDEHAFYIPNPSGKITHSQEWYYNVLPAAATIKDVIWESSNDAVVSVDGNGKLTPGELGTATITVKTVDGEHIATTYISVQVFYGDVNNDWMTPPLVIGDIIYPQGGVRSSDALATLKYSVGDNQFEDNPWFSWRKTRADVKGNPSMPIIAYDAALIFEYAEGDRDYFPAQSFEPVRGSRIRDQIVANPQISLEVVDGYILIYSEDSTQLSGLNISIEQNQLVTLGEAQFNLPENYLSAAYSDEYVYNIGIAASVPELIENYLVMIPVTASEDTVLNVSLYSNIYESNVELEIEANLTSVDEIDLIEPINSVGMNYPNPFNPDTTIEYSVKETCLVRIEVYNIKGQLVKTLVNEEKIAGQHLIQWHGDDNRGRTVASGVYFYIANIGDEFRKAQRMMLLK